MMTKRKFPDPDGPARLREGHVRDREISPVAGAPKAYRNVNEHPLIHALTKKWIDHSEAAAGECYRIFYERMGRGGHDSTEFVVITGNRQPFTQMQVSAIRTIQEIERQLQLLDKDGSNWVIMVRRFCGEGYSMREAVKAASQDTNPRFTRERIRLALNKLSTAISKTAIDFRVDE